MSTGQDQSPEKQLEAFEQTVEVSKVDQSIVALEQSLARERDGRKEERFIWAVVALLLLDMSVFQHLGWIQSILIAILEAFILLMLARIWGLEYAQILLAHAWNSCMSWLQNGNKPKPD